MRRRRGRTRGDGISRRKLLVGLGGVAATGGLVSRYGSDAFTSASVPRGASADVVTDAGGVVSLDTSDSVQRNQVATLVGVTNNRSLTFTATVSLVDRASTDLYLNGTNVGNTATFDVAAGTQQYVEAETTLQGGSSFSYDVAAAGTAFSFSARRSAGVTAGNNASAVTVTKFSKLTANAGREEVTVGQVSASDSDNDDDLVEARYRVTDGAGTEVGSTTDTANVEKGGASYKVKQNSPVTIPATGLANGDTYTVRLVVEDADGNTATAYRDVTA